MLGLCILEASSDVLVSSRENEVALRRYKEGKVSHPAIRILAPTVCPGHRPVPPAHLQWCLGEEYWALLAQDRCWCVDVLILGQAHLVVSQVAAEWLLSIDFWHF